jgi:hypothetical protein
VILFSTSLAEIMSDSEFNSQQQGRAAQYRRAKRAPAKPVPCPSGVPINAHKNRHLVSAKLTETNWRVLRVWLVANDLNYNTGLNRLIATHPELENHA